MRFIEDERTELKQEYVEDIKKVLIAFANTNGGTLIIGVNDAGIVRGIDDPDDVLQRVMNAARDAIYPDITMFLYSELFRIDDVDLIRVTVKKGSNRPYYLSGKGLRPEGVYVRRGTSTVQASEEAIRRMIVESDGISYETELSAVQELTFLRATEEFSKKGIAFGENQMKTLGLKDRNGNYTNLALVLSDQCPHIIKAALFSGNTMEHFQDRQEFSGSLLKQLDDAYRYLDMANHMRATFDGLHRIDNLDYPEQAVREALLNAIVHRDYGLSASTLISVFDDRVEMLSIGGIPGTVTYDEIMLGVSMCRNPGLADIFYRLGLIEAYGTGIAKIMTAYAGQKRKPDIVTTSQAFKIILPNQNTDAGPVHKPNGHSAVIEEREETIMIVLSDHELHTRSSIERALGVSTSTARRMLQKLLDEQRIKAVGSTRNAKYYIPKK